jgi:Tol biopolymer transport system component
MSVESPVRADLAPPPPPPPFTPRKRRRWGRIFMMVGGVLLALIIALVVAAALVIHHLNTPATVPKSWRAPTALPQSATAAVPPGNLVFDSNRTGNYEIWTMSATGADPQQLTHDAAYDSWWARLSPDRRTILFYRTPKGTHDRDYAKTSLWAMGADGSDPVELRPAGLDGWVLQGHAEWSPDGTQLVMFGGSRFSPQIRITDALGQHPRNVTDRGGSNVDPSWAPDGRTIAFVGCPGSFCTPSDHEIYTVPAAGGPVSRITNDGLQDNDPYFSHSGHELAWLTKVSGGLLDVGVWDIRTMPVTQEGDQVVPAAGATPHRLIDDRNINSKPSWSLDDRTIYFHRAVAGLKDGFQVWAVDADGTNLHELTKGQGGSSEYPGT